MAKNENENKERNDRAAKSQLVPCPECGGIQPDRGCNSCGYSGVVTPEMHASYVASGRPIVPSIILQAEKIHARQEYARQFALKLDFDVVGTQPKPKTDEQMS